MEEQILSEALKYINFYISTQLSETVSLAPAIGDAKNTLPRNIVWRCKSLIDAMWLMLLLDRTKSKFNVKCSHCGNWFYSERSHGLYCGTACKRSANTETQIYKAECLKKNSVMNLLSQGKSISEIGKLEKIRKKTIEKWINENVEV
ncbi:hypothetical protein LGK97_17770 [Clostridium sp. CS001]|uniref:hypothetical protein n=1 Tax=Clostridium sp. CS001 TaxID=2880648 RepID=UPI001CF2EF0A|nr:hypothetical protein [Clostridium sp. CS001]MCB2291573.1 hypothetical protein [Clostridium sp. CS001]